jgi:hypothetical protein
MCSRQQRDCPLPRKLCLRSFNPFHFSRLEAGRFKFLVGNAKFPTTPWQDTAPLRQIDPFYDLAIELVEHGKSLDFKYETKY